MAQDKSMNAEKNIEAELNSISRFNRVSGLKYIQQNPALASQFRDDIIRLLRDQHIEVAVTAADTLRMAKLQDQPTVETAIKVLAKETGLSRRGCVLSCCGTKAFYEPGLVDALLSFLYSVRPNTLRDVMKQVLKDENLAPEDAADVVATIEYVAETDHSAVSDSFKAAFPDLLTRATVV